MTDFNKSFCERSSSGSAYLELLLVLPLLAFIALACFEYSQLLNQLQFATSLSREVADVSYRECLADADWIAGTTTSSNVDVVACLERVRGQILQNETISDLLSQSQIIVAVYSFESGSNEVLSRGSVTRDPNCTAPIQHCASRYSVQVFEGQAELNEALRNYGTLVTAEVILPFQSFVSSSRRVFPFLPEVIYGTTIL